MSDWALGAEHWALGNPDFTVVAEHEAIRRRLTMRAANFHVLADQARFDAAVDVGDRGVFKHDRVLDLAIFQRAAVADRRVWADIGMDHARAAADDRRS